MRHNSSGSGVGATETRSGAARSGAAAAVASNDWFNLETIDDDLLCARLKRWRGQPLPPLVLEVFFEAGTPDAPLPALIERWFLTCHADASVRVEAPAVYKRAVVLCRVLAAQLLLLPAHGVHKQLRKHRLSPSHITYQLKAQPSPGVEFVTPPRTFRFADIATPRGAVRLAVGYLPDCSALRPAMPLAEQVLILNYDPSSVGGAAALAASPPVASSPPTRFGSAPRSQPLPPVSAPAHRGSDFVNSAPVSIPLNRVSGGAAGGSHASVSPRSDTFLVGSYAYSASPQLSPRSPTQQVGFDVPSAAAAVRQRSGSSATPETPLVKIALTRVASRASLLSGGSSAIDDSGDIDAAAAVGDQFDDEFEVELDALQQLTNSSSPFGRQVDPDAAAPAAASDGVLDTSAIAAERFMSLCAAPPRLRLFEPGFAADANARLRLHTAAFDLLRQLSEDAE